MAEERPAKRRRFTSDVVTIKVGTDDGDTFKIYSDLLKKSSRFFSAALDKKWKEGQSLHIDLPEDKAKTIEAYLGWLYDGKIDDLDAKPNDDKCDFILFCTLYVYGEKIQDPVFCNGIMDAMTKAMDEYESAGFTLMPCPKALTILYNGTPEDSPARKFIIRNIIDHVNLEKSDAADFPTEFMQELLQAATSALPGKEYRSQFAKRKRWYKSLSQDSRTED